MTPAQILGLSQSHGTIEVGKSASLVVADGDLFAENTRVLETWVDGSRYEIVTMPKEDVRGTWALTLGDRKEPVSVKLTGEPTKPRGKLSTAAKGEAATKPTSKPASQPTGKQGGIDLANVSFGASQIAFTVKGDSLGMKGVVQISATVSQGSWLGVGVRPDGTTFTISASRTAPYTREDETADKQRERRQRQRAPGSGGADGEQPGDVGGPAMAEGEDPAAPAPTTKPAEAVASAPRRTEPPPGEIERPTTQTTPPQGAWPAATQPAPAALSREAEKASTQPALFEVTYPLGAFGRSHLPEQPAAVLFKNATVWTSGPRGKLAGASVLVEHGKISAVYAAGEPVKELPEGALVIDCTGKHVSPGIIDCHSHIATDGGDQRRRRSRSPPRFASATSSTPTTSTSTASSPAA